MDLGKEHPEQIPTEYNEEQTLRAVRKQSQIPRGRKAKTINDFPKAETVGQALKDLGFPADKQTSKRFVTFMKQLNATDSKEILLVVEKFDEKVMKMFQKLQMRHELLSDTVR